MVPPAFPPRSCMNRKKSANKNGIIKYISQRPKCKATLRKNIFPPSPIIPIVSYLDARGFRRKQCSPRSPGSRYKTGFSAAAEPSRCLHRPRPRSKL